MNEAEKLNATVWATIRPSSIHGIGVFAIRDIPKGTKITSNTTLDLKRPKTLIAMGETLFATLHPEVQKLILDKVLFYRLPLTFYSPNDVICLQSFMNHSDTPNSDGIITLRDIAQNEEITEDYRTFPGYDRIHPFSKEHNPYLK